MTLTCVQRERRRCLCALCACVSECVCCAKERGVQYERLARANRATDSAPAWRQWKTKHGSTCVEKEQSICPWRQPLLLQPPFLFPSFLLFLSFSSTLLLPWFNADRNKARAGVMRWMLGQKQHWTLCTHTERHAHAHIHTYIYIYILKRNEKGFREIICYFVLCFIYVGKSFHFYFCAVCAF